MMQKFLGDDYVLQDQRKIKEMKLQMQLECKRISQISLT
jgi:hypothetical protein